MIVFLKRLIFGKSIDAVLNETKSVRIKGIRFRIRKVNVLDYLGGSNILSQVYDTYKVGKNSGGEALLSDKKIKEYFSQVLVAGVVSPKLSFKDDGDGIFVEKLFFDQEIMFGLYEKIMLLTYGKKKMT